ncbi:MAG TPA: sensor domain-containing diguanylate cyclase [Methylophilaceae bacterium]|nr:sensor domain-containing diguanylate cyclase [Methylophilaceae bacterium]
MKAPAKPANEQMRLDMLRSLHILDSPPEERFDRITRLAKRLFGVPIVLVTLVDADRQWFKSAIGLDMRETSREISFCSHAILSDEILTVRDAAQDERFNDNPLVTETPNIRFYAGCPLAIENGSKLGTLCLIDREPRDFNEEDRALLRDLAHMVEQEIAAMQLATIDGLTLLSNRRGFENLSRHAMNICRRQEKPACLLFFDLNHFKQVNDRYGHAEGDEALVTFSKILKDVFRESDVIGRLGGDEFVVLLTDTAKSQSPVVLQRLQHAIDTHNHSAQRGYDLAFSVGAVEYDAEMHHSVGELLQEADTLMYQSKRQNRADFSI